tara:strand:+ start:189 stop:488 length:300 start_codon:yes stop_codon:yes gene_type:complete
MIDTLHIDDLDGAVTLFKSTDEGTETIAVFDEEHREVIQDLLTEIKRLREAIKNKNEDLMKIHGFCGQALIWPNMNANARFNYEVIEEIEKIALDEDWA